jgi:hypothetical protein
MHSSSLALCVLCSLLFRLLLFVWLFGSSLALHDSSLASHSSCSDTWQTKKTVWRSCLVCLFRLGSLLFWLLLLIVWLFDCLIVWLFDCLIVWLFDCLIVWLLDCLIVWLFDCLIVWLFDCLIAWLLDCLIVWLFDCLIVWLFDCLIVWLCESLAVWLFDCLIQLVAWFSHHLSSVFALLSLNWLCIMQDDFILQMMVGWQQEAETWQPTNQQTNNSCKELFALFAWLVFFVVLVEHCHLFQLAAWSWHHLSSCSLHFLCLLLLLCCFGSSLTLLLVVWLFQLLI